MARCFVGRQPIFDTKNRVFAYDLLYRNGLENEIGNVNRTVATSRVIVDAFVEIGIDNIVGRHRVLLNVDSNFLIDPDLVCVPTDRVALQLSDSLEISPDVITGVEYLKTLGYQIALSGYSQHTPLVQLLGYADMVKLDALSLDDDTLAQELSALEGSGVLKIAKRVETTERRNRLAGLGFDYFQGHFLTKPEVIAGQRLPSNRVAVLDLVSKICDPDLTSDELADLIAMDASLSLRTLRFVNSPLSGLNNQVESIQHAVVLLGRNTIKNWVMLLAISELDNSISELITTAFVRAKVCEQLADEARIKGKESFFTVGLFSLMDAMLETPMEDLLDTLPFSDEVKTALNERTGTRGEAIRCAEALERGTPDGANFRDLHGERIAELYLDAINWADHAVAGAR